MGEQWRIGGLDESLGGHEAIDWMDAYIEMGRQKEDFVKFKDIRSSGGAYIEEKERVSIFREAVKLELRAARRCWCGGQLDAERRCEVVSGRRRSEKEES